jgi:hypothetical protein
MNRSLSRALLSDCGELDSRVSETGNCKRTAAAGIGVVGKRVCNVIHFLGYPPNNVLHAFAVRNGGTIGKKLSKVLL